MKYFSGKKIGTPTPCIATFVPDIRAKQIKSSLCWFKVALCDFMHYCFFHMSIMPCVFKINSYFSLNINHNLMVVGIVKYQGCYRKVEKVLVDIQQVVKYQGYPKKVLLIKTNFTQTWDETFLWVGWMIFFNILVKNIQLIWRCHHCRGKAGNFIRLKIGSLIRPLSRVNLYCSTPGVTLGLG